MDINYATPEALMDALIHVTVMIKHYTQKKKEINERLTNLLELERVESKFDFDGYHFSFSSGRKTYSYPDNIVQMEADLEEAKAVAVNTGKAIEKTGSPFWSLREVKPK